MNMYRNIHHILPSISLYYPSNPSPPLAVSDQCLLQCCVDRARKLGARGKEGSTKNFLEKMKLCGIVSPN